MDHDANFTGGLRTDFNSYLECALAKYGVMSSTVVFYMQHQGYRTLWRDKKKRNGLIFAAKHNFRDPLKASPIRVVSLAHIINALYPSGNMLRLR